MVRDKETKEPSDPSLTAAYRAYQIAKRRGCMTYPTAGVVQRVRGDNFIVSSSFIITEDEIDAAFDTLGESLTNFEAEGG